MARLPIVPLSEISSGSLMIGGVALAVCATYWANNALKRRGIQAPCPRGIPFVGNLFQVFGDKPFLTFAQWAKQFGDVFMLQLGTQSAVVISSIDAAKEALVSNGKVFAGRPLFYTMSTLHDKERKFVFAPHPDDLLKLYRKTVLADTRKRTPDLEPLVENEIQRMKDNLFQNNENQVTVDMRHLIHKLAVNIAHGYAMGSTFDLSDNRSEQWSDVLDEYRELLHWFRVENFLPHSHLFLRGYKERVSNFHQKANKLFMQGIEKARERRQMRGKAIKCNEIGLIDTILDMFDSCKDVKDDVNADAIAILRDVMFGCADGSYQPLTWALLFLCNHQHVLKKLQEELDENVGRDRMPLLSDRDNLPFVEATIREVMRLSEITTLGIPRRTLSDVTVGGFHIPKDTLAIFNVYAIHRDSNQWESPSEFNPDRYFDQSGKLRSISDLSYLPFSSGQRSCPGQNIARSFIYLLFARFFQTFNVEMSDEEVPVGDINAGGSFNPEVKPFKVTLTRRF